MRLNGLLPLIASAPPIRALIDDVRGEAVRCTIGVADAAKPVLLATLLDTATAPTLIVTPRPDRASALAEELALYLSDPDRILSFPEADTIPYERITPDLEAAEQRLRVLRRLAAGD